MDANELLPMFKTEFEKNIEVLHEVKDRIVSCENDEDLALAIQTYVLMLQRICEGAAALGLNGVYLYLQTVCLNVYEAKSLSCQEQEFIADLYVFWIDPLVRYLDAALTGGADAVGDVVLSMLEGLSPPNVLLETSEEALVEMMESLGKVMDVDESVQKLMDEVNEEREEVFLFDESALEMKWSSLDRGALAGLLAECQENLESVERGVLACEEVCAKAISGGSESEPAGLRGLIDEAKRAAHTIKGSSQMGGLPRLSLLLHKVEDLFDYTATPSFSWKVLGRPELMKWTKKVVEEGGKLIEAMMDEGFEPSAEVSKVRLGNFLVCLSAAMNGLEDPSGLADAASPQDCGSQKMGSAREGARAAGEEVGPAAGGREVSGEMLSNLFEGISNSRIRVNHIKTQNAALVSTLKAARQENDELNKKLDELARFVSAHLLDGGGADSLEKRNYSEVYTMCVSIGETNNNMKMLLDEVDGSSLKVRQQIESVEKNERNLSQQVLRAQMVDFGSIAGRLKRVVGSTADACGKVVDYSLVGAGTLIEKGVLDKLRDPLMHLLRNAVDHGLSDRSSGALVLRAESFGNKVRVAIEDNGAGINVDAIKKKALERGVVSQAKADQMSVEDMRALIFENGFSTKDAVSEISGRGVGLDVVKKNVEGLGGSVGVRSRKGGGTIFELLIPSNMSSVNCLVIKHAGGYYAVPTSYISKILEPSAFRVARLEAGQAVAAELSEEWAHVEWDKNGSKALSPAMDFKSFAMVSGVASKAKGREARAEAGGKKMKALMLRFGSSEVGVLVEETLFIEDMIVRKANALGRAKKFVLGTTILLNGDIVPILNVGELMLSKSSGGQARREEAAEEDASVKVLVVDDSLFMRNFLEKEVEAMGYEPILAINGLDAVRKLKEPGIKMVLTDLEMPEMDGLELTKFIKGQAGYKDLPVFLITSRSTQRYRELAKEVGVDVFMSKPFEVKDLDAEMSARLKK